MGHLPRFSLRFVFVAIAATAILSAIAAQVGIGGAIYATFVFTCWATIAGTTRFRRAGRRQAVIVGTLAMFLAALTTELWSRHGRLTYRGAIETRWLQTNYSDYRLGSIISCESGEGPTYRLRGLGFCGAVCLTTYSGGDYIMNPFVTVRVPYWFVLTTSILIIMKLVADYWSCSRSRTTN